MTTTARYLLPLLLTAGLLLASCSLLGERRDKEGNPIQVPPCPEGTVQKGGC
jgi:hypothetical protein